MGRTDALPTPLTPGDAAPTTLVLETWNNLRLDHPTDYHNHTSHTDGTATVAEMAASASTCRIREILFSEHVRHTSTYFPRFVQDVRSVAVPGLTAKVGAEAKILNPDGHLDCPPEVAAECDGLIGSVHSLPANGARRVRWSDLDAETAVEREFELSMAIVTKSRAHILGHPMGISVTRFGASPLEQLFALARACREAGKAFELNARYCGDPAAWIDIVKIAGCKVSLGSDAHKPAAVGTAWATFTALR